MELTAIITNASLAIFAFSCLGLSLLYGDSLLLRWDLRSGLKTIGFLILSISSILDFFNITGFSTNFWLYLTSYLLILIALILDPHSKKIRILAFAPLVGFFLLQGHMLLFLTSLLCALTLFYLVVSTKHNDLILFALGFLMVSVGEFFYSLEGTQGLKSLASAGSFLYIFASGAFIPWVWSYFAIRVYYKFTSKNIRFKGSEGL